MRTEEIKEEEKKEEEKIVNFPTPKRAKEEDVKNYLIAEAEMIRLFHEQENIKLRRENSILKLKIAELNSNLEAHQFDKMKLNVEERIKTANPKYNAILKKIAEDTGISDPKNMSIDTDTYIVREIGVDIPAQ